MGGNRNKIIEKLRKKLEAKKTQDLHSAIRADAGGPITVNGIPQPPIALADPNKERINPLVEQFAKTLTPEQIAQYKAQGEHMYNYDYVNAGTENGEAMEYIRLALRSGLLPESLAEDEKEYLKGIYGEEWETKVMEAI